MLKQEKRIVGFVDILGFTNLIKEHESGKIDILNTISEAMRVATGFLKEKNQLSSYFDDWRKCVEVKLFSDCLCISIPISNSNYSNEEHFKMFYKYLMGYQIILMEQGFFCRGGVSIGGYYSDDSIIFSGALVKAYELESKVAKMPRVIVCDEVFEYCNDFNSNTKELMFENDNGVNFLNHFNYSLVDSELADETKKTLPGLGSFDISFEELDLQQKKETIVKVMSIIDDKINLSTDPKVNEKLNWLRSFCSSELLKIKYE